MGIVNSLRSCTVFAQYLVPIPQYRGEHLRRPRKRNFFGFADCDPPIASCELLSVAICVDADFQEVFFML